MPRLNILIVGSGNETEAFYNKLKKSDFAEKVYLAGKTSYCKDYINFKDYDELAQNALKKNIDFVFITSENEICNGTTNILASYGLNCIGTNKKYSRLASSKLFAKIFMDKYNIQHPKTLEDDYENFPIIIKSDDIFTKNSPQIIYSKEEKKNAINKFKKNYFFEEYLNGEELSVISFFDGEKLLNFEPIKNEIRNNIFAGSYCPYFLNYEQYDKLQNYLTRFEHALLEDDANFKGFIISNLIWNNNDWIVLSFNVSSGEKQTQTLMTHLKSDILATLVYGTNPAYKDKTSATLWIENINEIPTSEDIQVCGNLKNKNISISTTNNFPFKILEKYINN